MLRALQLQSDVRIERDDFRRVLAGLRSSGWTPAALEAELRLAELAGFSEREALQQPFRAPARSAGASGEFFFSDGELFYLLARTDDESERTVYGNLFLSSAGLVTNRPPVVGVEVGVVTGDESGGQARLKSFAEAVEASIKSNIDGRKTRHMTFSWASAEKHGRRLAPLRQAFEDEGIRVRFREALLTTDSIQSAEILALPDRRELLQEVSRAGFARESDMLSRRSRKEDELRNALTALADAGLLRTEYLLQCRATNGPLTRLSSPDELDPETIGALPCPTCQRKFGEELLLPGYLLSELGRSLVQGSHWMTVWVTTRLVSMGVPIQSILWNFEESSEEVDIILEFLGQLWVIELKDRDFQPGDAHPFNYRAQVRYQADKALIVTVGKVSPDARRVFQDLAKEARKGTFRLAGSPSGTSLPTPTYIEGLGSVERMLSKEISDSEAFHARQAIAPVTAATGFDLTRYLARRR